MSKEVFKRIQQRMADAGFYHGKVDGLWGPLSDSAHGAMAAAAVAAGQAVQQPDQPPIDGFDPPMAWGAKVSRVFRDRVRWIGSELGIKPDDLMGCMAFETGRTFRPDIRNGAGSGATGLIQFMPLTALAFWYSHEQIQAMTQAEKLARGRQCCDRLAAMTAEDQLNYVYKYFLPYKGRLKNVGDVYMAILWPAGVGKPDAHVLWDAGQKPTTYAQNRGLDVNGDRKITRGEAVSKVMAVYQQGLQQANMNGKSQ